MSATHENDHGITYSHPTPTLDVLELDNGDSVLYDPDEPEAYLQADPSHVIELDGRWR